MQRAAQEDPQSEAPEPEKTNKRESSVGQRWLTAAIVMPIVLVFAWLGGWWSFAAVTLVVLLGAYELHMMLRHAGHHPIMPVTACLIMFFLVAAMFPPAQRLLILESGLSAALVISFLWLFFRKKLDGAFVDWALTLAIAVYLGWSMSFFLLLRGYEIGWPFNHGPWWLLPRGVWWLLTVLLGVWGFDTAAFFTGRYFGRHKLAPRISPGKTWEGVFGGLVLSIIAALLCTVKPLGVPWYLAIVLGIVLGCAAVVGDLAESLIKRQTHVKDSGQIMPGHGGMLDRIDSLMFAVIVVYAFAQLIGG
ncbi:MAG TPA: phosphatidate cytidylyltransferase [Ktedonobacteraceae bacterium]|nr:phosphatidate cytidylyltransferase [Ktedonobacteraceae bacterium]